MTEDRDAKTLIKPVFSFIPNPDKPELPKAIRRLRSFVDRK
jgi:hypothetical protein